MTADPGVREWRRLSVRMLLIHPIHELLRAWPVLIGLVFAGTANGHGSWWSLAATILVIAAGLARWFTTRYRVTPEQVQVRKGLLRRRVLTVPRDRIRTVDVTANALHRSLGLARVEVGTGRTDRKDEGVRLDALQAAEAARLRDELLHRHGTAPDAARPAGAAGGSGNGAPGSGAARDAGPAVSTGPATPAGSAARAGWAARAGSGAEAWAMGAGRETQLARMRPGWIRYGPFTLTGFLTVGVVASVVSRALNEAHVDPRRLGPLSASLHHWEQASPAVRILAVVVLLIAVVAVASTLGYVLTFYGFRLTRSGAGTLHVTRGLITTRATTIEERRLRGVELSEPMLLRAVRGARCVAITTGLRVGRGAERGGSLLLPAAPRGEAVRVAGAVLGDEAPLTGPLVRHGGRATRRRFTRAMGAAGILVAAVFVLVGLGALPGWAGRVSLLLLPPAALVAYDRARALGHAISGGFVVSRRGSLVRRRSALSCEGIIGWNLRRSFFQRRSGLTTLVATTAAGRQRIEVPDVPAEEALRIADAAVPGLLAPFLTH